MPTLTAQDVATYFLHIDAKNENADGISHLKMQKLVYYAYGFYYTIFNERLFDDVLSAWQHGPVCESLYHTYSGYGKSAIPLNPDTFTLALFSQEQRDFLEDIYREYAQHAAWKLSEMTHEESPWLEARRRAEADGNARICDSDILAHFQDIVAWNETAAILRDHPTILEDIAENNAHPERSIPLDALLTEFGLNT